MHAGAKAAAELRRMFADESGFAARLLEVGGREGVDVPTVEAQSISDLNLPVELEEKAGTARYPAIRVFCECVNNELREKFRTLSGSIRLVVEIRATADMPETLARTLELYSEAALRVLNSSRGEWQPGLMFPGTWQATFGAMKRGGRNYIQVARIQLDVIASE